MGSHSYSKIIVDGSTQAHNDDCYGFVFRDDGPRTTQWNIPAFIVHVIPIWTKILKFLWHSQFFQNQHQY